MELAPDYWAAMDAGRPDSVIIIDNGSNPPLRFRDREYDGLIIRSEVNRGFSAANNLGLKLATTDVVVFVNDDVEATTTGWLDDLVDAVEPGVLVGPRICWSPHGSVDGQQLPYLDGWCLAGMREDFVELGGFDESYQEPAYFSDNDLCLRARAAGMTLREVRVGLRHKLNVTAGHGPDVAAASLANQARFAERARELLVAA